MARKAFLDSRENPYHLTARSNNRETFPGTLGSTWRVLTSELYLQSILHEVRIHAFVLMPNHFHLLATSPQIPAHRFMKEVLGSSTRILNTGLRRSGRIFGGPYHWSLIRDPLYFAHALKYVYRNPVKAGLAEQVGEYPYSSISGILGKYNLPLKISAPLRGLDALIPSRQDSLLDLEFWLNQPHGAEENAAIRKGLRKKEFAIDQSRIRRKKIELSFPF